MSLKQKECILYVGGFNFNKTNASSIRVIENARFFKHLNYNVKILGKIFLKEDQSSTYIDGVEIFDIEDEKTSFASDIIAISTKVEASKTKIDYIIAYNFPPIAFSKLIEYCGRNEIVLIPDLTEWYGIDGKFTLMKGVRLLLNEWRMYVLNKKCKNKIVASSYLETFYKNGNNLRLPFVTVDSIQFNKEISIDKHNLIFVYAGSPGENFSKDRLDIIIKAFAKSKAKYKNFTLNIVGLLKNDLLKFDIIKDDLVTLGDNIVCYGSVRNEKCVEIIKGSNFVVFARDINRVTNAGYPTKVFEAFKYGVPVITNKTSDIALHVNTNNGFLIEKAGVNEFSNCIENILSVNVEVLKDVINNCRHANPFYYSNYKQETIDFFKKIS